MTAVPGLANGKLKDQALLNQGPLARALKVLNGEGEETRLVGDACGISRSVANPGRRNPRLKQLRSRPKTASRP
jgi:hypothetical protein